MAKREQTVGARGQRQAKYCRDKKQPGMQRHKTGIQKREGAGQRLRACVFSCRDWIVKPPYVVALDMQN
jgi:hypothetical protein